MQRTFTIELRVNYADGEKNDTMKDAIMTAAHHLYAQGLLLADGGTKPEIAAFSDDWFSSREQIELIPDKIKAGKELLSSDAGNSDISNELMNAMRSP